MTDTVVLAARIFVYAAAGVVLFKHHRHIREAIETFYNNFPGGGQPPTHPSPAADDSMLSARLRKT